MSDVSQASPDGVQRSPTGEILDQTARLPPEGTEGTEKSGTTSAEKGTEADTSKASLEDGKTLLTDKKPVEGEKKAEVPEKYEFKPPADWAEKGFELDTALIETATPLFKELGLSQEGAQKLVDFYAAQSMKDHEATAQLVIDQNNKWIADAKAEFGNRLTTEMKPVISKAIDSLGEAVSKPFRQAMDDTGLGNHPDFIRAMYAFAQKVTEGGHVAGRGPTKESQAAPGASSRPSAASAMYPNLPSATQ
jgi:hypothetical protein